MIMEAVMLKVRKEDEQARKDAERAAWHDTSKKQNFTALDEFR
jgi:hypothetical protein